MPRKVAGDRTTFETFAELHPLAAVYLAAHHPGERIELQPFANKVWRDPNTDTRLRFYVSGEMEAGVPYDRAIKKACKIFGVKASRIRALMGPAPTPEEIQDRKEDEANTEYDAIECNGMVLRIERPTPTDTILRRILTSMPHRTRNTTIRMRRLLVELHMDGVGDLPRLLGYGWGLRPIPLEKRRAVFARLSSYSPAGRFTAEFLEAQATRNPQLPALTSRLLTAADKKMSLRRLICAAQREYESSDEFWWSFEDGLDTSRWKIHPDDEWDPHQPVSQRLINYMMGGSQYDYAFLALESFALSHRFRVLVVPKHPWMIPARNQAIREEFKKRRDARERVSDVIDDLAEKNFRSRKQIEEIVYRDQEDEPKNLHQEPGFDPSA